MFSFAIFFPWRTLDLQLAPFCSSSPRAISCIGGPLLPLPPPSSNAVYQFLPLCFLPVSCLGAIPYPSSLSFPLRAIPYLSSSYLWIRRRFKHRRKRQSFFINQVGECPTGRFLFSLLFSSRSLSSSKVGFCLLLFLLSRAISHRTILLLHENGSCFCLCFFFPCDLRPKSSPPPFCPSASASIPRISKRKERLDPLYTPAAELQRKNESGAA